MSQSTSPPRLTQAPHSAHTVPAGWRGRAAKINECDSLLTLGLPLHASGPPPAVVSSRPGVAWPPLRSPGVPLGGGRLLSCRQRLLGSRELLLGGCDLLLSCRHLLLGARDLLLGGRGSLLSGSGGSQGSCSPLLSGGHPPLIHTAPPADAAGLPHGGVSASPRPDDRPLGSGCPLPRSIKVSPCADELPLSGGDLPLSAINLPSGPLNSVALPLSAGHGVQNNSQSGDDQNRHWGLLGQRVQDTPELAFRSVPTR